MSFTRHLSLKINFKSKLDVFNKKMIILRLIFKLRRRYYGITYYTGFHYHRN